MGIKHITRAELKALLAKGWTTQPAFLYEPEHAPNAQFIQIDDMPTQNFRRLIPPKDNQG